ncbi:integrator complex subunit 10 [Caerostris darwini]|uniref:Integrator complex subunit 10 n=1 Tax=Caerostris darwini TaxID=1538125 RepID=A0AAV4R3A8_9ARAC|nr:integrator complex subunit 10 [Caerostris darwini]
MATESEDCYIIEPEEDENRKKTETSLISKTLHTSETDPKYWMIFAKSLFPEASIFVYECYREACEENDLYEIVKYFGELIEKFPETVNGELNSIVQDLHSDSDSFIRKVFELLPADIQHKAMLAVTQNASSLEERCELMLLFLKQMYYPKIFESAYDLIYTLRCAEQAPEIPVTVNYFRKMLVCDVFLLLLQMPQVDKELEFNLLEEAIEFYACCIFKPPTAENLEIVKSLQLCNIFPSRRFQRLLNLLEALAIRNNWDYPNIYKYPLNKKLLFIFLSKLRNKDKYIFQNNVQIIEISTPEELFFSVCFTFFYCLYDFARYIFPQNSPTFYEGRCSYFLVEGIVMSEEKTPWSRCPGPEFHETERGYD